MKERIAFPWEFRPRYAKSGKPTGRGDLYGGMRFETRVASNLTEADADAILDLAKASCETVWISSSLAITCEVRLDSLVKEGKGHAGGNRACGRMEEAQQWDRWNTENAAYAGEIQEARVRRVERQRAQWGSW